MFNPYSGGGSSGFGGSMGGYGTPYRSPYGSRGASPYQSPLQSTTTSPQHTAVAPRTASAKRDDSYCPPVGIGATIDLRNGKMLITHLRVACPAVIAGVKVGSEITAVTSGGKTSTISSFARHEKLKKTAAAIRGPENSFVTLTLRDGGDDTTYDIKIRRGRLIGMPTLEAAILKLRERITIGGWEGEVSDEVSEVFSALRVAKKEVAALDSALTALQNASSSKQDQSQAMADLMATLATSERQAADNAREAARKISALERLLREAQNSGDNGQRLSMLEAELAGERLLRKQAQEATANMAAAATSLSPRKGQQDEETGAALRRCAQLETQLRAAREAAAKAAGERDAAIAAADRHLQSNGGDARDGYVVKTSTLSASFATPKAYNKAQSDSKMRFSSADQLVSHRLASAERIASTEHRRINSIEQEMSHSSPERRSAALVSAESRIRSSSSPVRPSSSPMQASPAIRQPALSPSTSTSLVSSPAEVRAAVRSAQHAVHPMICAPPSIFDVVAGHSTVSGLVSAPPHSLIVVYVDGSYAGSARAQSDGSWTAELMAPLQSGKRVTATVTDSDGRRATSALCEPVRVVGGTQSHSVRGDADDSPMSLAATPLLTHQSFEVASVEADALSVARASAAALSFIAERCAGVGEPLAMRDADDIDDDEDVDGIDGNSSWPSVADVIEVLATAMTPANLASAFPSLDPYLRSRTGAPALQWDLQTYEAVQSPMSSVTGWERFVSQFVSPVGERTTTGKGSDNYGYESPFASAAASPRSPAAAGTVRGRRAKAIAAEAMAVGAARGACIGRVGLTLVRRHNLINLALTCSALGLSSVGSARLLSRRIGLVHGGGGWARFIAEHVERPLPVRPRLDAGATPRRLKVAPVTREALAWAAGAGANLGEIAQHIRHCMTSENLTAALRATGVPLPLNAAASHDIGALARACDAHGAWPAFVLGIVSTPRLDVIEGIALEQGVWLSPQALLADAIDRYNGSQDLFIERVRGAHFAAGVLGRCLNASVNLAEVASLLGEVCCPSILSLCLEQIGAGSPSLSLSPRGNNVGSLAALSSALNRAGRWDLLLQAIAPSPMSTPVSSPDKGRRF